ncbi:hypothetical protein BH23VER1_BH23VER1_00490 [soil metagenome]
MTKSERVLGIDGGSTKTEWALFENDGPRGEMRKVDGGVLPAANFKILSRRDLRDILGVIQVDPEKVGIFLAGCGTELEADELGRIARERWPGATIVAGSDRESALATAFHGADGIAVIAGTGSAVHGTMGGKTSKAGGWGQLLGDRGSGYDLAMQGLRACLWAYDMERRVIPLARSLLAELALNRFSEFVDWVRDATKTRVAKLAPVIFDHGNDPEIAPIIERGAQRLAEYTLAVSRRLAMEHPQVRLLGGIFANHPEYSERFAKRLHPFIVRGNIAVCTDSAAGGAAWLAAGGGKVVVTPTDTPATAPLAIGATELPNPRSEGLDSMPVPQAVRLFIDEEAQVAAALAACQAELVTAVEMTAAALRIGGRLFYVGAGTSGRLGVLDASEIPPTFGSSPDVVQGIIAGGAEALVRAVEGAEDREWDGRMTVRHRDIREGDVVCGITASGRTPFVLGALAEARSLGADTILLTCNPDRPKPPSQLPWDVEIDLPTGPEIVAGSTRLKAGTATKLALNVISTLTMVQLGHVHGNRMVDLQASNSKLRDRATHMVAELRGLTYPQAKSELERADWNIRATLNP